MAKTGNLFEKTAFGMKYLTGIVTKPRMNKNTIINM